MDSANNAPSRALQYFVLTIGIFAISSGAVLIRLAQNEAVPSLVIALWRTGLSAAILLPFTLVRKHREVAQMDRLKWSLAILSGLMLGIHFSTWITSLSLTSITSSTVLVATAPLWVGLGSPFFLNEPLTKGLKQGIALAILGVLVVSFGEIVVYENGRLAFDLASSQGSNPLLGNLLALIGGITAGAYLIIGRRLRPQLSLLSYTTIVYGMAAITILIFNIIGRQNVWNYSITAFALFVAVAVFPQLVGHTSFNWALSFLPAAFVSVAAISEPVGASILAIIIFQEIPGLAVIVGSVLILAGVFLSAKSQT